MDSLTERTPRVVSAVKLARAAERKKTGLFLAEGFNAVSEAARSGAIRELFFTTDALERHRDLISSIEVGGARVFSITDRAAKALSDTVTPQGLIAVTELIDVPVDRALAGAPRLVAAPVQMAEPGNAGTVIRVADAAGADAVVLLGDSVDPHNGKCVRASAGSVFHLPIARERSIASGIESMRRAGLTIVATAADGEVDLDDADQLLTGPTAWLFGNEAHGLPESVTRDADHRIRIPIYGRAESLNLATAAAICLYASARVQRRSETP